MPGFHPQGFRSMAWTFQRVSKVEDLSFISSLKTPIPTVLISVESSQSQLPVWPARATVEIKHVLWTALERRGSCTESTRLWYLSKTSWLSLRTSMGFCLGKMLEQASKVCSHELKQDDRVRQWSFGHSRPLWRAKAQTGGRVDFCPRTEQRSSNYGFESKLEISPDC